jgi:phosphoribosylamine-glycine ligase
LSDAVAHAYDAIQSIGFEGMHYRKDIAQRALKK